MFEFPKDSPIFQDDFIFGVATAAQQIEGGRNQAGRVDSIWDRFCDQPGNIKNGDKADIACDHINLWKQDVELIADLGVDAYRFSIAWPRVIKDKRGSVNQQGLDFYKRLLDSLHEKQLQPFVTLYHWDLPHFHFDSLNPTDSGWLNRDTTKYFADYVHTVTEQLADRIPFITTFNEPWCSAIMSYDRGIFAPGLRNKKLAYKAAHNLLLAHGLAMQVIRDEMPNSQAGIVLNLQDTQPASESPEDEYAAKLLDSEFMHMYLMPLLEGKYPENLMNHFVDYFEPSWQEDMDIIQQPMDYLGLNYYTRVRAKRSNDPTKVYQEIPTELATTEMGWEIYPQGLFNQLTQLNQRYKLPAIYITENGMADADRLVNGEVNDLRRCEYLQQHLKALNEAIAAGVDVKGYFAWSLMDNFEWAEGYAKRFGLYYVDYKTQERYPKQSAKLYRSLLQQRNN